MGKKISQSPLGKIDNYFCFLYKVILHTTMPSNKKKSLSKLEKARRKKTSHSTRPPPPKRALGGVGWSPNLNVSGCRSNEFFNKAFVSLLNGDGTDRFLSLTVSAGLPKAGRNRR